MNESYKLCKTQKENLVAHLAEPPVPHTKAECLLLGPLLHVIPPLSLKLSLICISLLYSSLNTLLPVCNLDFTAPAAEFKMLIQ